MTLIGYVGLVYAFVGDVLIFGETFTWVEIACTLVILSFNVTVIVFNLKLS